MLSSIIFLIIGLVILVAGGEILVRGSASIAAKWKVSPLVIGLTIVAFGTSAPELVVNIFSTLEGSSDIAIGNVLGSNISNILLILGISAIIYPITVKKGTIWKEIPLSLLAVIVLFFVANDVLIDGAVANVISRADGFILITFFLIFLYYTFGISKVEGEDETIKKYSWLISSLLAIGGIIGLAIGGRLLVDNAIVLAELAGLSESLIGLTIVAIGTSLPELATSVIAVRKRHTDLAIGNIVGSNIFNIFWIVGLTSSVIDMPFNSANNINIFVATLATLILFIFVFASKEHKLGRRDGILFVLLYLIYITMLVLNDTGVLHILG